MSKETIPDGKFAENTIKIFAEIETRDRLPDWLPNDLTHLSLIRNLIFPSSIAESNIVRDSSIRYSRVIKRKTDLGKEKFTGVTIIKTPVGESVRAKKPIEGAKNYDDIVEREEFEIAYDPNSALDRERAIKLAYLHRANLMVQQGTEAVTPIYERIRHKKFVWFPDDSKVNGRERSKIIVEVCADHCVVLPGQPDPVNEKYKFEQFNVFEIEMVQFDKKLDKYKFLSKLRQTALDKLRKLGISTSKAVSKKEWLLDLMSGDGILESLPGYSFVTDAVDKKAGGKSKNKII